MSVDRPGHNGAASANPVESPGTRSQRQALASRLTHLLDRLSDETIAKALGEDDIGTLTTLASPEAWTHAALSPRQMARLRGVEFREKLLERAGGALSVGQVADMLGVTAEAVRKRLRNRTLIGIKHAKGYAIPAVQFPEGSALRGLGAVLQAIPVRSEWMRLDWLLSPEPRLADRTPLDVLRNGGDLDAVTEAASTYGEQGAA